LQRGEKVAISEITDEFVAVNTGESAQPNKKNAEAYREVQAIQDEMSASLRGLFGRHRRFLCV
jgi:hypothetical protein